MPQGKHTVRVFVDPTKRVSMTAESDAMAITDLANWMDVTSWRFPLDIQNRPSQAVAYAAPQEFDIRVLCDANEDLTAVSLYGVFEEDVPAAVVGDTFTAVFGTDILTSGGAHNMLTGDGPIELSNSGGALPAGLLPAPKKYWVIDVDGTDFQVAESQAEALAGTAFDFSDNGTGTHSWAPIADQVGADDVMKRLHWALLGSLNDGTDINVDVQEAYIERARHNPLVKYYAMVAGSGVGAQTVTVRLDPVFSEER